MCVYGQGSPIEGKAQYGRLNHYVTKMFIEWLNATLPTYD
jgi:hypothetical protein